MAKSPLSLGQPLHVVDWINTDISQRFSRSRSLGSIGVCDTKFGDTIPNLSSLAHRFLQAGCSKVYITSRKAKACEEACALLNKLPNRRPGAQAISVPADGSKVTEIERLVAEVAKTTDHVDILFANAGATWGAPFEEHTDSSFAKVMDLNVKSVFFTVQK
jgi:hypothetical protein